MSSVISFVRHRKLLLMALALFGLLAVDSLRPPAKQVSSGIYIAGVHAYQRVGRPVISRWVHCRCQPTCSEYSVQAVREHGIARGLLLTGCRLAAMAKRFMGAFLRLGRLDQPRLVERDTASCHLKET